VNGGQDQMWVSLGPGMVDRDHPSAALPWSTATTTEENKVFFLAIAITAVIKSFALNNSYYRAKEL
jgi:hypothetical protein